MNLSFIHSFQSEWLKTRRSLASWLVLCGAFFTPLIIIVARLVHHDTLPKLYASDGFWNQLWRNSWESMAIFLLPVGVVLATSLVAQLEFKNNTWKQLHTVPLSFTTIFFAKLSVILVMLLQFFVLFNIGIYLSALIPYLLVSGVPYPKASIPWMACLKQNGYFFLDCLPIVALQYLISMQFKNFLVPVGVGFLLWIAALGGISWKYGYWLPYTYCMFNYLKGQTGGRAIVPAMNIHLMAVGYCLLFTAVSYTLYLTKKEKG